MAARATTSRGTTTYGTPRIAVVSQPTVHPTPTTAQTSAAARAFFPAGSPAVSAAPVSAPSTPAPLPVSLARQALLDQIAGQMAALPGVYNAQRLASAVNAARGLTDQGLADTADYNTLASNAQGSTYGVGWLGEGQRARNLRTQNAGANDARGTYYSTQRARQDQWNNQAVTNTRDALLRGLQQGQDTSLRAQQNAYQGLSGEQNTQQAAYDDWRAQQTAPVPVAPTPQTPAPGEAGSSVPRTLNYNTASRPNLDANWSVVRQPKGSASRWLATWIGA